MSGEQPVLRMADAILTRRQWIQATAAMGVTLAGSRVAASLPAAKASEIAIGSRRELFIDDFLIDQLTGLATRRMHRPVPREVVIVHDAPWEGSGSGYHTILHDGDLYRLYYRGLHLDVSGGKLNTGRHQPFYCYAESQDGRRFHKPELGIVEFNGSSSNNIILEGLGTHNFAPFIDANPDCPASSRYKALGGIKQEGGLFAFQSSDGIHWSQMSDQPVITNGAFDSQNVAFWDPAIRKYRAYWRIFTEGVTTQEQWKPAGIRAIRTGISADFLQWGDDTDLVYRDSPPDQLYTNQIAPYHRAPHTLIGLPTRYVERGWSDAMRELPDRANRELRAAAQERYGTAITEALLMASHDGIHFDRWNEAFLRPGIERPGSWQYGQQYVAHNVVETTSDLPGAPNELSLYATENYWHGSGGQLRRYTLRIDGFVSIHASRKGGELITNPLTFSGSQLTVNFATSAVGSLRCEIQNPAGKPMEGFALADCPEHFGDTLERAIRWNSGSNLAPLAGKPVRLRFVLHDADLYSLRFQE